MARTLEQERAALEEEGRKLEERRQRLEEKEREAAIQAIEKTGLLKLEGKRLSGLVAPSNRYRRYLGPPLSRRWPCSFLGFVGNDYGRRSSDTRFGHARLQFFTIEQRLKRLD